MSTRKRTIFSYCNSLDEKRERELRDKMKEIDFRKADYEDRLYSLQVNSFILNNEKFSGNKEGIPPHIYSEMLENELYAHAEQLEREQTEEREQRQRDAAEKEEKELGPLRFSFRQQLEDMGKERAFEDKVEEMEKDSYNKDWDKEPPEMEEYYDDY